MYREIVFNNIRKEYPKGIVALDHFNVTIPHGKTTAFIGANGSGKTTALKLLTGLIKPTEGVINFLGFQPFKDAQEIRRRIGYINQDIGLDPESTGKETLSLFASLYGINGVSKKNRITEVLEEFELTSHSNKQVKTYSGGLKQRLHLAIGLIHQPEYILLDEPTNSLDPKGKRYVWDYIQKKDQTVIIVTHDLQEATTHCDHIIFFDCGKILAQGAPSEIINTHKVHTWQIQHTTEITPVIKTMLEQTEGIERVVISKNKITLSIRDAKFNEALLVAELDKHINSVEIRKKKPNLSTAYFSITGKNANDKQQKKNQRKK